MNAPELQMYPQQWVLNPIAQTGLRIVKKILGKDK
jgi:hypothetical protein